MRIATWNLQSDRILTREREALFWTAIDDVDADVWVLTETWVNFSPGIGYRKVAESSAADDLKAWPDRRWVAIWARENTGASHLNVDEAEESERCCAARIALESARHLIVFGTVLPWRSDAATTLRGAAKYEASLAAQASGWERVRKALTIDSLCVAGDFNQELESNGPTGTKLGCAALAKTLSDNRLVCMTGGKRDPLKKRGWGESIDHIMLDDALAATAKDAEFWPVEFPLSGSMSDHHGVYVDI